MNTHRLAILISGSGSTMDAVFSAIHEQNLTGVEPIVVVSSDAGAAGLTKATARGIPTVVIERKTFSSSRQFGEEILDVLSGQGIGLVAQLGWLPLTPQNVIQEYPGNIFNQHPGPLDPGRSDFGGRGMYGIHVHAAVIAYQMMTGELFPTEATTHVVTEEFDRGRIIGTIQLETQVAGPPMPRGYFDDDDHLLQLRQAAVSLQKRLLPIEHRNVIGTIQRLVDNTPFENLRKKPLIPEKNLAMLGYAKMIAARIS